MISFSDLNCKCALKLGCLTTNECGATLANSGGNYRVDAAC